MEAHNLETFRKNQGGEHVDFRDDLGFQHGGSSSGRGRFRGGLVFKAHRLCESLNSRLESNTEEEEERTWREHCRGLLVNQQPVHPGLGIRILGFEVQGSGFRVLVTRV